MTGRPPPSTRPVGTPSDFGLRVGLPSDCGPSFSLHPLFELVALALFGTLPPRSFVGRFRYLPDPPPSHAPARSPDPIPTARAAWLRRPTRCSPPRAHTPPPPLLVPLTRGRTTFTLTNPARPAPCHSPSDVTFATGLANIHSNKRPKSHHPTLFKLEFTGSFWKKK